MMMMMMMITSWHICLYLLLPDPVLHYIEEMGILFLRLKKVLNCNSHKEKRGWKVKREVLGLATGGHQIISFNWNSFYPLWGGQRPSVDSQWAQNLRTLVLAMQVYIAKTKQSTAVHWWILFQGLRGFPEWWQIVDVPTSKKWSHAIFTVISLLPPCLLLPLPPMPCKRETT